MPNTVKVEFQGALHDAVPIEANQSSEHWNQYLLDDGSTLKLKAVVTNVYRLLGVYKDDGDPIYVIKSGGFKFLAQQGRGETPRSGYASSAPCAGGRSRGPAHA